MGERHDHRRRRVEEGQGRLGPDAGLDQGRIQHAIVGKHDLPGEDAQEIAGPERQRHQEQQQPAPPAGVEGQIVGDGIGRDHRGQSDQAGDDQGAQRYRPVERIGKHRGEIGDAEAVAQQRAVIGAKGEKDHQRQGKQDQQEGDQCPRQQHGEAKARRRAALRRLC